MAGTKVEKDVETGREAENGLCISLLIVFSSFFNKPTTLALPGIQCPHPESWQRAVAYRSQLSSVSKSPTKKVTRKRKKKAEIADTDTVRAATS